LLLPRINADPLPAFQDIVKIRAIALVFALRRRPTHARARRAADMRRRALRVVIRRRAQKATNQRANTILRSIAQTAARSAENHDDRINSCIHRHIMKSNKFDIDLIKIMK
jgi:hypothetical protein